MADRTYTFNYSGSVAVTTTWLRIRTLDSQGNSVITSSSITTGSKTITFPISGITLDSGESIKRILLKSTRSNYGTVDGGAACTINGATYLNERILKDVENIVNGQNYSVTFKLRASGNVGATAAANEPVSHSMTTEFSNIQLEVLVGTGTAFDGKVSSLEEGEKIYIEESAGVFASYTLVKHNYNSGKALIFRDDVVRREDNGNPKLIKWHVGTIYSGFDGCTLDNYLNTEFFNALPSTTRQFLQSMDYPIVNRSSNPSGVLINRNACTISSREAGDSNWTDYGEILPYTDTIFIGVAYWTRESASQTQAKYIRGDVDAGGTTNNHYGYNGVRPTLGVLETQIIVPYEDGYTFGSKCGAPANVYLDGAATNKTNLQTDVNCTLSWSAGTAGTNAPVAGYNVLYSTSASGTYSLYGTTTSTSLTIIGPPKGFQTYYFKVQTITNEDRDYCDSDLSSTVRSAATKNSNIYYYDGAQWLLALPKYYSGEWITTTKGAKYYNGTQWIVPDN